MEPDHVFIHVYILVIFWKSLYPAERVPKNVAGENINQELCPQTEEKQHIHKHTFHYEHGHQESSCWYKLPKEEVKKYRSVTSLLFFKIRTIFGQENRFHPMAECPVFVGKHPVSEHEQHWCSCARKNKPDHVPHEYSFIHILWTFLVDVSTTAHLENAETCIDHH